MVAPAVGFGIFDKLQVSPQPLKPEFFDGVEKHELPNRAGIKNQQLVPVIHLKSHCGFCLWKSVLRECRTCDRAIVDGSPDRAGVSPKLP